MHVQSNNQQENASIESKYQSQKKNDGSNASQFEDNRPEAFQLKAMKTLSDNSSQARRTAQLQQIADNSVKQLKTEIKHTTSTIKVHDKDPDNHTVGVAMKARLDPKDPVVGSATGVNSDWMKKIRKLHPNANVVRGHLLNHDLGGFGIEENLFPISTLANANHSSQVEQNVKGELYDLNGIVKAKNQGYVYYNVVVGGSTYKDAEFKCGWGVKKPNSDEQEIAKDIVIPSKLGTDKGGFGGGKKGKHSPVAWQHGRSKGGTEVNAVRERLGKAMKSGNITLTSKPIDHQGKKDVTNQDAIEFLNDLVDDYGASEAWDKLSDFIETCTDPKYVRVAIKLRNIVEDYL